MGRSNLGTSTLLLGLALAASVPAGSAAEAQAEGWRFSASPYLWVPRIDGTLNLTTASGIQPVVEITPIDYVDNLNVPLMFAVEARHGKWTVVTDLVFVDFSGEKAAVKSVEGPGGVVEVPIDIGSRVGLRGTIWTLGGGYAILHRQHVTLTLLGGVRYFRLKGTLDWQFGGGFELLPPTGHHSQSDNLWDAVLGVRGKVLLGAGRWFLPYHLDAGTGSSTVCWHATAGVAYAFGWGDMLLTYRHLQYESGSSDTLEKLRLTGPALGVTFRF